MNSLEHYVCLVGILIINKIEVTRGKATGIELVKDLEWAVYIIGGEDNHMLIHAVGSHQLDPHNEFFGLFVIKDVRTVHFR